MPGFGFFALALVGFLGVRVHAPSVVVRRAFVCVHPDREDDDDATSTSQHDRLSDRMRYAKHDLLGIHLRDRVEHVAELEGDPALGSGQVAARTRVEPRREECVRGGRVGGDDQAIAVAAQLDRLDEVGPLPDHALGLQQCGLQVVACKLEHAAVPGLVDVLGGEPQQLGRVIIHLGADDRRAREPVARARERVGATRVAEL